MTLLLFVSVTTLAQSPGRSGDVAGLDHARGLEILESLRRSPDPEGIETLVRLADATGSDELLGEAALEVGLSTTPEAVRQRVAFPAGLRAWREGRTSEAVAWFEFVTDGPDDYWAHFLLAQHHLANDRRKSAVETSRVVMKWPHPVEAAAAQRLFFTKDHALLVAAAAWEAAARWDQAVNIYQMVDTRSLWFGEAMGHVAQIALDADDRRAAEKAIAAARKQGDHSSSAMLEGATARLVGLEGCRGSRRERTLEDIETRLGEMHESLSSVHDLTSARGLSGGLAERLLEAPDFARMQHAANRAEKEAAMAMARGLPVTEDLEADHERRSAELAALLQTTVDEQLKLIATARERLAAARAACDQPVK